MEPVNFWMITADRRTARLLFASVTAHGRLHVEQKADLEEVWDEFEHGRPSGRSARDGLAHTPAGHEEEERTHRFAKQIAHWLRGKVDEFGIERVHAFCAPRILGPLRKALPGALHDRVMDHATDLAQLTPGELAVHHAVVAVQASEAARLSPEPG